MLLIIRFIRILKLYNLIFDTIRMYIRMLILISFILLKLKSINLYKLMFWKITNIYWNKYQYLLYFRRMSKKLLYKYTFNEYRMLVL